MVRNLQRDISYGSWKNDQHHIGGKGRNSPWPHNGIEGVVRAWLQGKGNEEIQGHRELSQEMEAIRAKGLCREWNNPT